MDAVEDSPVVAGTARLAGAILQSRGISSTVQGNKGVVLDVSVLKNTSVSGTSSYGGYYKEAFPGVAVRNLFSWDINQAFPGKEGSLE